MTSPWPMIFMGSSAVAAGVIAFRIVTTLMQ
jgi:hypothetical protein